MSALGLATFAPRFPQPKPTTIVELEGAERLVVWALRSWRLGGWRQEAVWREFIRQFADDAAAVLSLFEKALCNCDRSARRPFRSGAPGELQLFVDELCFLLLIAALQAGDERLARSVAGWIVRADAVPDLFAAAKALAAELDAAELICPMRVSSSRIRGAEPILIALQ